MLMTKLQEAVSKRPNDFRPARETEAYGEAKLCALRIARANVDSLLAREDAGEQIFLQLSNALTLHARYRVYFGVMGRSSFNMPYFFDQHRSGLRSEGCITALHR